MKDSSRKSPTHMENSNILFHSLLNMLLVKSVLHLSAAMCTVNLRTLRKNCLLDS